MFWGRPGGRRGWPVALSPPVPSGQFRIIPGIDPSKPTHGLTTVFNQVTCTSAVLFVLPPGLGPVPALQPGLVGDGVICLPPAADGPTVNPLQLPARASTNDGGRYVRALFL